MTSARRIKHILAIGAHPDDVELGCGGALAKHASVGDVVVLLLVTTGAQGPGDTAARVAEQERAAQVLGVDRVIWGGFPDCEVSLHELALVHLIEKTIRECGADVVYTHSMHDSHQDHRSVALGTLGAARQHPNILCYESPSSLAGYQPNVFVDVSGYLDKKLAALQCHRSQVEASEMVSDERVRNTAGYRGHQARVEHAEAFEAVRFLMDI